MDGSEKMSSTSTTEYQFMADLVLFFFVFFFVEVY